MPTILLKRSNTPGSVPGTANLTNLAGGAEVAVNTADRRMFTMTSASAVVELGTNPSSLTVVTGANLATTSGNVGIGTASPTFKLVAANSATDGGWIYSSAAISILGLGGYANAGDGAFQIQYNRGTGAITFNGGSRDTPAERMRITSGGNLLVGTTTDVSGLSGVISDVAGNVRAIPRAGAAKTSTYTLAITDIGDYVELGTGGGIDVPNGVFSTGDAVSVFNNTTGNRTISLTITTAYIAGTDSDKASVTLATRGIATILFISNSVCIVTGNVS